MKKLVINIAVYVATGIVALGLLIFIVKFLIPVIIAIATFFIPFSVLGGK